MKDKNPYSYCNVVGDTNVGCKRKANEDWLTYFESENGLVSVVCDGMGGHVGGAVASHLAVETIEQLLKSHYYDDPRRAIVDAANAANAAILKRTSEQPELKGMGATLVMLVVRDGKVYLGSVGDSRIYLIRSKTITQLTKDQSFVQMLVDSGELTKEQAEHHPRKNEITNALGLEGMRPATVLPDAIIPEAGDCFLLCSDGLSGMVSDHDILKVVSNQTGMTQRERVNELIRRAREKGGLDNITSIIVEFAVSPQELSLLAAKRKKWLTCGIPAAIIVLALCLFLLFKYVRNNKAETAESEQTEQTVLTDSDGQTDAQPEALVNDDDATSDNNAATGNQPKAVTKGRGNADRKSDPASTVTDSKKNTAANKEQKTDSQQKETKQDNPTKGSSDAESGPDDSKQHESQNQPAPKANSTNDGESNS